MTRKNKLQRRGDWKLAIAVFASVLLGGIILKATSQPSIATSHDANVHSLTPEWPAGPFNDVARQEQLPAFAGRMP